ncbi:hypothetical protein [Halobaculum sp. MBLA0143]|uniref:DUF7269 family protein n=1 Tax=Halobaculum sp. MBLA0143 TaxID=3079933 RepID=UPI003523BAC0
MSLRGRFARAAGRTLGRAAGRAARWWGGDSDDGDEGGRLSTVLPSGRRVFDAVAVAAVAGAAASLAGLLPAAVVRTLSAGARPALGVIGVATVTVVLLTWGSDETDDDDEWTEELRAAAPERVPAGDAVPLGAWVTVAADGDDRIADAATVGHSGHGMARERLTDAAVETLTTVRDVDETAARAAVADGSWTDDPRAAAYLADGETPTVSPTTRLRDWFAGERRARRVRATARAIRRLDPGAEEPAVPEPTTDAVAATTTPAAAELTASVEPEEPVSTDPESADSEPTVADESVAAATDGGETGVRREVEE